MTLCVATQHDRRPSSAAAASNMAGRQRRHEAPNCRRPGLTRRRGRRETVTVPLCQRREGAPMAASRHTAPQPDVALRVKALEQILAEKRLIDRKAIDELVDTYEHRIGPHNGARVVARAWVDPDYKQRLLANATAAIAEL